MKNRLDFFHSYSLTSEWLQQIVDFFGAVMLDEKRLIYPETIAFGGVYFSEIISGMSVLLIDTVYNVPVSLTKVKSEGDFSIFYYDLSDEINIHVINNSQYKTGYRSRQGFGIVDNRIRSTYIPVVKERSYSLRIFVSNVLLKESLLLNSIQSGRELNNVFDDVKYNDIVYDYIDSKSKVLLYQLKNKSFLEPSFDLLIRGVALNLFGYFLSRSTNNEPISNKLSELYVQPVLRTKEYLLTNLRANFPGIDFLADMADISVSKYKLYFKEIFNDTPNNYFIKEKMLLAKQLLKSGNYSKVSDVSFELGYTKPGYFSAIYKKQFNQLPSDHFISDKIRFSKL